MSRDHDVIEEKEEEEEDPQCHGRLKGIINLILEILIANVRLVFFNQMGMMIVGIF